VPWVRSRSDGGSGEALAEPDGGGPHAVRELRLTITLFMTGLLGIAFEVLVVRLAAQVMQNTMYTFAGLLAAYLLGTATGGLIWQRAGRHAGDPSLSWLLAATALACLGTAFLTPFIAPIAETAVEAGISGELAIAIALFLVPAAAMGALFGFLGQIVRDRRGSLGRAVGINGNRRRARTAAGGAIPHSGLGRMDGAHCRCVGLSAVAPAAAGHACLVGGARSCGFGPAGASRAVADARAGRRCAACCARRANW